MPITIDAVRAGKDVYCEKPVTHTMAEGAPLIAAVREIQAGRADRHAAAQLGALTCTPRRFVDGTLGQVTLIRTYWYQNHIANQDAGPEIDTVQARLEAVPRLARPDRPFDADQYAHWRWYWDFGGGAMTDLFVHWVDVAQWYHGRRHARRARPRPA